MKNSTKRKILIVTLKSIRVIAWLVACTLGVIGAILLASEPPESLGAGTEFLLTMIQKTLTSIAMFIIAFGAGSLASKISQLFKECGIK